MSDKVLGLDLSDYRPGVPLRQAKRQGVRFVIGKCSEGTNFLHKTYEPYKKECDILGLPYGGYLYWRFIYDAVKQAEYYCDHLGKVQFPPIVDVERYYNRKPGTTGTPLVSVQANRNHLKIVLDTIEEITGIKPMIYTNYATWYHLFANWAEITKYPVWVANWRAFGEPTLPKPATTYDVHQWTSSYKVETYPKGVDANWFNGNEAAFEKYIAEYEELWRPAPPPPPSGEKIVTLETLKGGDSHIYLLDPGDSVSVKVSEV